MIGTERKGPGDPPRRARGYPVPRIALQVGLREYLSKGAAGEHVVVKHPENVDAAIFHRPEHDEMSGILDRARRVRNPLAAVSDVVGAQCLIEAAIVLDPVPAGCFGQVFHRLDEERGITLPRQRAEIPLAVD